MAQKYYNLEEAAEMLGVSVDELRQMRERQEINGYRDGTSWKFKSEDVQRVAKELRDRIESSTSDGSEPDEGDVLLSEAELGESGPGSSGTVIGMEGDQRATTDSDLQLADSDAGIGEKSGVDAGAGVDSKASQFEELNLALEEDLTLEDSAVPMAEEKPKEAAGDSDVSLAEPAGTDSALDLSAEREGLADDELVVGGSGTGSGSDITIGGDSGISLVDPTDSGLSLEEPLELAGGGDESLELGEADMISATMDSEAPAELKPDDDFLLTPLEEVSEDDESESGSQVIALDTEGTGDEAATMLGSPPGAMAAMLDEDVSTEPLEGLGVPAVMEGPPVGPSPPAGLEQGAPVAAPSQVLPEAPYSVLNVASLALCVILLTFGGMFMYDLLRNMWSWGGPYEINSAMMDKIIGLIE